MLKAQVTFKGCQRDIVFRKAWTVQRLRYLILLEFYLQMQDKIPPACLTIMLKRNDMDKHGVELSIDEELFENVKIIAKLASTPQAMVSCFLSLNRIKLTLHQAFFFQAGLGLVVKKHGEDNKDAIGETQNKTHTPTL